MADTQVHLESRDIVLSRRFDAPCALVYQAWTNPQMLVQWFGPAEFTVTVAMLGVRPGDAFTVTMHGPDGTDYPIDGEFGEVIPGKLLVMIMTADRHPETWHAMIRKAYLDAGGDPGAYAGGPIITRVTFADDDGGTLMTVRQTFPSAALLAAHAGLGNPDGWSQSFDKLDAVLPGLQQRLTPPSRLWRAK